MCLQHRKNIRIVGRQNYRERCMKEGGSEHKTFFCHATYLLVNLFIEIWNISYIFDEVFSQGKNKTSRLKIIFLQIFIWT